MIWEVWEYLYNYFMLLICQGFFSAPRRMLKPFNIAKLFGILPLILYEGTPIVSFQAASHALKIFCQSYILLNLKCRILDLTWDLTNPQNDSGAYYSLRIMLEFSTILSTRQVFSNCWNNAWVFIYKDNEWY